MKLAEIIPHNSIIGNDVLQIPILQLKSEINKIKITGSGLLEV